MGQLLEKVIKQNRLLYFIFFVAVVSALFLINGTSADALYCMLDSQCDDWQYCQFPGSETGCRDVSCSGPRYDDAACSGDAECGVGKYCASGGCAGTLIRNHECTGVFGYPCCQCSPPSADCDLDDSCEVGNLNTDWNNCGTCRNDCTTKAAYCVGDVKYQYTGSCSGGSCNTESLGCQNECCIQSGDVCNTDGVCAPPTLPCPDEDGDGYGNPGQDNCAAGSATDCNDNDASVWALNSCGVCAAEPAGIGQSCTAGVGLCQSLGTYVCDSSGTGKTCNAVAGTPTAEICGNGMDEDCNGADLPCPNCSNSVTDPGEVCDPASAVTGTKTQSCSGGYPSVTLTCRNDCTGYTGSCGSCDDGTVNGPEQCEIGQTTTYTCTGGKTVPQGCSSSCTWNDVSSACISCTNGIKDGTETGVDCGGSCTPCVSCTNGVKDGTETGVDCGGSCVALDCSKTAGVCSGKKKTCEASGWTDCTAADYGSNYEATETKCDTLDNDCDGVVDEGCTSCTNGIKDGMETGIDCGGSICVPPVCSKTLGVCAGKSRTCSASGWVDCTAADYGSNYEATETKCDTLDNDCDGVVDEGCAATKCGNGVIDSGEQCDKTNMNGNTCASVMGAGSSGTLKCYDDCIVNIEACTPPSACYGQNFNLNQGCCLSYGYEWEKSGELSAPVYASEDGQDAVCSGFRSFAKLSTGYYSSYLISGDKVYYAWIEKKWGWAFWDTVGVLNVQVATLGGQLLGNKQSTEFSCVFYESYGECAGSPKLALKDGMLYIAWANPEKLTDGRKVRYMARFDTSHNQLGGVGGRILPDTPAYSTDGMPLPTAGLGFNAYGDYAFVTTQQYYSLFVAGVNLGIASTIWIKPTSAAWQPLIVNTDFGTTTEIGYTASAIDFVSVGGYTYYAWAETDNAYTSAQIKMVKVDSAGKIVATYYIGGRTIDSSTGTGTITNVNLRAVGNKIYSSYTYWGGYSHLSSFVSVIDTESGMQKPYYSISGQDEISKLSCTLKGSSSVVDGQFKDNKGERTALDDVRLPQSGGICSPPAYFPVRTRDCASGVCTSSANDKALCDKPSDCIFNGRCYSDVTTVAATFFGGDTSEVLKSAWKDEVSADVNSDGRNELCDPGMWVGIGGNALGVVTDRSTGAPIANAVVFASSTNKVYNYSTTTAADGTYTFTNLESTNYDFSASKIGYVTGFYNNVPVQPSKNVQVDFQLDRATSNITGYVTNISKSPEPNAIQGALVRVVGTAFSGVTDASGRYTILDVPQDTYDLVASKVSEGYQDDTKLSVQLLESTVNANFTLLRALGQCNGDCTSGSSNACDASCHGKGSCWFDSDATKQACDGTFGLVTMPDGSYVDCCMGKPFAPTKANMQVPADNNVIVTKVPVLFKGKFVNMVIAVFNNK